MVMCVRLFSLFTQLFVFFVFYIFFWLVRVGDAYLPQRPQGLLRSPCPSRHNLPRSQSSQPMAVVLRGPEEWAIRGGGVGAEGRGCVHPRALKNT